MGLVPQLPFRSLRLWYRPVAGCDGAGAAEIGYNRLSGHLAVFLSFFLMTEKGREPGAARSCGAVCAVHTRLLPSVAVAAGAFTESP